MNQDRKINEVPMIPKYQVEQEMLHISGAIRAMVIIAVTFAVAIVVAVYIFVSGYNARTKDWLNTIANMQRNPAVTEAINGIQQQSPP
jgi:tetrahydromethanopterin S-methyltransferase subunit D